MKRALGAVLVSGALVATTSAHAAAPWRDGDPVPTGYHREVLSSMPWLLSGGLMFGLTYAASLSFVGATSSSSLEFVPLLVPVLGPFIQLGVTNVLHPTDDSGLLVIVNTALIVDAVTQAVGFAFIVYGAAMPTAKLVRDVPAASILPLGPLGTPGLSLRATF